VSLQRLAISRLLEAGSARLFGGRPQDFHRLAFGLTGYWCFTAQLTGLTAER
jgi:hypothetical protein